MGALKVFIAATEEIQKYRDEIWGEYHGADSTEKKSILLDQIRILNICIQRISVRVNGLIVNNPANPTCHEKDQSTEVVK